MKTFATPTALRQPVRGLPDPGEKIPALARPTVALYMGTLALVAAEMYAIFGAGWSPWATVPMGAGVTFLMFSVLHESTHHAISTNTRLNDAFGHLSMPFVVPYGAELLVALEHRAQVLRDHGAIERYPTLGISIRGELANEVTRHV